MDRAHAGPTAGGAPPGLSGPEGPSVRHSRRRGAGGRRDRPAPGHPPGPDHCPEDPAPLHHRGRLRGPEPGGGGHFQRRAAPADSPLREEIAAQTEKTAAVMRRREERLRGGRPYPELAGEPAIIVDDGLASGYTMRAAVQFLRARAPARSSRRCPPAPSAPSRTSCPSWTNSSASTSAAAGPSRWPTPTKTGMT